MVESAEEGVFWNQGRMTSITIYDMSDLVRVDFFGNSLGPIEIFAWTSKIL